MAQQTTDLKKNRFVHHDELQCQDKNVSPIWGYQYVPVQKLEEAMEYIIFSNPDIKKEYVNLANEKCKKDTKLTLDESAAIYLYSMQTPVHNKLNDALRTENPNVLKIWLPYLKLLIAALNKLPLLEKTTVWRGVKPGISFDFENNPVQRWWSINSCSKSLKVIEAYLNESGTFFAIETVYGTDISQYSAMPDEEEVILMPGTRVRLQCSPLDIQNRPYTVSLLECPIVPEGKHVMLSCHPNDQKLVSKIGEALENQHFQAWFNQQGGFYNIRNSLADGVNKAAVFCCFLTPEYEQSVECQVELKYAKQKSVKIIPCILKDPKIWEHSKWIASIIDDLECVSFDVFEDPSDIDEIILWLIYYMKKETSLYTHLSSTRVNKSCYLFETVKYEYQQNNHMKRFMNSEEPFPIEQRYINLLIVNAKHQHEKEKQMHAIQHDDATMDTYEDTCPVKITIDVRDLLHPCKSEKKQVIVFGRAGIGKSTFCRYIAYLWAQGSCWPEYELVALIPLHCLTKERYPSLPPGQKYTLIDLVKTEVFRGDLSKIEEEILREHFDEKKTLWVLDGYDEIVQNIPTRLKSVVDKLLDTPHHIITTRPYLHRLSYPVSMEIIGFTDENISKYVKQFFEQMEDKSNESLSQGEALLKYLQLNRNIWGIAHIPINLQLICITWSNARWSENAKMTMTMLYEELTVWVCRRYLGKQKGFKTNEIDLMDKTEVYEYCQKELAVLESFAFQGMQNNTTILSPGLLKKALKENQCTLIKYRNLLNMGILKSFTNRTIETPIEAEKHHYFLHRSFQEYFAARYLVNSFNGPSHEKPVELIRFYKRNPFFELTLVFTSGLLSKNGTESSFDTFWNTIVEQPSDLLELRSLQLVNAFIEEACGKITPARRDEFIDAIKKWIQDVLSTEDKSLHDQLDSSPKRFYTASEPTIIDILNHLLQCSDPTMKTHMFSLILRLPVFNLQPEFIDSLITMYNKKDSDESEHLFNELQSRFINPTARQIFEPSPDVERILMDYLHGLQLHDYSAEESVRGEKTNWEDTFDNSQQPNNSLDILLNETNSIAEIVCAERFTLKYGRASQLGNDGRTCQDNGGLATGDGCVVGGSRYWSGIHKIKMRVERGRPFIGILSHDIGVIDDETRLKKPRFFEWPVFYRTPSAHGWCTSSGVPNSFFHWYPKYQSCPVINGKESSTQTGNKWTITNDNDGFQLILNCDEGQLSILNETTREHDTMSVDLSVAPLPWRLFVVFCDLKSRVHLLQDSKRKESADCFLVPSKRINNSFSSSRE